MSASAFLAQLGFLFGTVLLPVLLTVGAGAMVQKRHKMDMGTLSRVQVYLLVPVFLFHYVYTSDLGWGQMAGVAGGVLLAQVLLAVPLWGALHLLRAPKDKAAVVLLSSFIFNAGNFGIPVALRAFGDKGASVQALVVMVANLSLWGLGYVLMGSLGDGGVKKAVLGYFRLPMVYVIVLALLLRGFKIPVPEPLLFTTQMLSSGLVPLALLTLGAQLMNQVEAGRLIPRWRIVLPVAVLKLVVLPLLTWGAVRALGLWPWPGAQLIVAAAAPSAVNTLLLAMEQGGDVELAAECVFWTTVFSALTVTITLALVKGG